VNAGTDQNIFGTLTATLDGTLTDLRSSPPAKTTTWSIVSGPGTVTFGDANAVDTTATLSVIGVYVLRLTATDGTLTVSDDVTVGSYANACDAAKAQPGYTALVGDINSDCKVNFLDFAELAANWLDCVSLQCP